MRIKSDEDKLMCGICGTAGFGGRGMLQRMISLLEHRGPDGVGYYEGLDVFLANCRLAVVDVERGKQPVYNETKDIIAVYNGEIFNYKRLRMRLLKKGHLFYTDCDSEIIPHLYEDMGPDFATLLEGMFAIALYDRKKEQLLLFRDSVGIKPLFYTTYGSTLSFASEAKALFVTPNFKPEINSDALHLLMNMRFIPGNQTLFRGIFQLLPGEFLTWRHGKIEKKIYYDFFEASQIIKKPGIEDGEIWEAIKAAVSGQMIGEVPMGVALSGGLDSSAITAAMGHGIMTKTFTLGFNEPTDEIKAARLIAEHFTTDHHDTVLSPDALNVMNTAIYYNEIPKVNCLQGYYLYKYMSDYVKVAFSGLGGDELFYGYEIYNIFLKLSKARRILGNVPGYVLMRCGAVPFYLTSLLFSLRGDLLRRKAKFMESWDVPANQYILLRNAWDMGLISLNKIYTDSQAKKVNCTTYDYFEEYFLRPNIIENVAVAEFKEKMVNDFLWNEDRMSMANSVEARVPLLDKSLVRMAFSLDPDRKTGNGPKGLLRDVLKGILPEAALIRPKWGFTFNPVLQFQKDLGPMARSILTEKCIKERGIFNWKFIKRILYSRPHPSLRWHYFFLWQVLGLEYWMRGFIDRGYFKEEGKHILNEE
ncbi:MAG: asparagine synthase (glutamine-hydrolyzing) [bacterium]